MEQFYTIILFLLLSFFSSAQSQKSEYLLTVEYKLDKSHTKKSLKIAKKQKRQALETNDFVLFFFQDSTSALQLQLQAKKKLKLLNIHLNINQHLHPSFQLGAFDSIQYLCNGFQSWTTTIERNYLDKEQHLSSLLNPYGKHLGDYQHYYHYPKQKGQLHSWTYTYLRLDSNYTFIGSLNDDKGFTCFKHDALNQTMRIQKDCQNYCIEKGDTFEVFDLVIFEGNYATVWSNYRKALGPNPSTAKAAIGWTSWYNYYDKINQQLLLENLDAFETAKIPLDIFQIDDGYQYEIGDWLTCNTKFPNGMAWMADKIHQKKFKAGLWLAPFIASKKSKLFQKNPDWFVKDKSGKPLKVAINVIWKAPYYALDIYNPEVQEHLKKVIQTILYDWNYDMIKVDFLFAACLQALPNKTRGMIMSDAMHLLRQWAGDKLILACGVPLASAFHQVDYCRVGNDAHTAWEFGILKALGNAERPSTWSTLGNSIHRYGLNEAVFLNDPDVFMLRDENSHFNQDEKYTLLLLNNTLGAVLFNSDDIRLYNDEQRILFRSIFPYQKPRIESIHSENQCYKIKLRVNQRRYIVFCNLSKQAINLSTGKGSFYDVQQNKCYHKPQEFLLKKHQSRLFYQIDTSQKIELLGGKNHLFSGQEIESISRTNDTELVVKFRQNAQKNQGIHFWVADPTVQYIRINHQSIAVDKQIASYGREKKKTRPK